MLITLRNGWVVPFDGERSHFNSPQSSLSLAKFKQGRLYKFSTPFHSSPHSFANIRRQDWTELLFAEHGFYPYSLPFLKPCAYGVNSWWSRLYLRIGMPSTPKLTRNWLKSFHPGPNLFPSCSASPHLTRLQEPVEHKIGLLKPRLIGLIRTLGSSCHRISLLLVFKKTNPLTPHILFPWAQFWVKLVNVLSTHHNLPIKWIMPSLDESWREAKAEI